MLVLLRSAQSCKKLIALRFVRVFRKWTDAVLGQIRIEIIYCAMLFRLLRQTRCVNQALGRPARSRDIFTLARPTTALFAFADSLRTYCVFSTEASVPLDVVPFSTSCNSGEDSSW